MIIIFLVYIICSVFLLLIVWLIQSIYNDDRYNMYEILDKDLNIIKFEF